ncbi:heme A synthase [uncultured Hymenobacter sp.]|uniref:COX15/CtaA family protein n=1 Tax=uncultured Hymenobacter sp. TaxID=170016 RepID=UPI0035CA3BDD
MKTITPDFVRRFRFVGLLTVAAVYLLILIGGVVRSTGSGMGCPDWPKCFGTWIPPTQASQLPANYKEIYTAQRVAKNQKLARTLERLGFKQVANDIFAHPSQYVETDFNPVKTWIEYLNRLLGALIGLFVFATALAALPYWQRDRPVFWLALASFLLTGVQGWLGSLVVSTNLLPIMVTVHMGLALLIVALLLYAVERARWAGGGVGNKAPKLVAAPVETTFRLVLWLALLLTFTQIVLGTQVREQVDMVAAAAEYAGRATWVSQLGVVFKVHRSTSLLVLALNAYLSYRLWQLGQSRLRQLALATMGLIGLEIVAGITLASWALPAVVQPVHLTLAVLLFGTQFLTLLAVSPAALVRRPDVPAHRVVA